MKLTLKTHTLLRLSNVVNLAKPVIMFEIKDNKCYIVCSNDRVGVVEYVGEVNNRDDIFFMEMSQDIRNDLQPSFLLDGDTLINVDSDRCFGKITNDMGYELDNCFRWFDKHDLMQWRNWFVSADESKGFMYFDLYQIKKLFESSSSGRIVFPAVIDSSKPLYIRDVDNVDWLGVFIPTSEEKLKPAELPEWVK